MELAIIVTMWLQLDLGIDVPCFTTVPLRTDEAAISLLHPGPEESDEVSTVQSLYINLPVPVLFNPFFII